MYNKSILTFLIFACLNLQASQPLSYTKNNEAISADQLHKIIMHSHLTNWIANKLFEDSLNAGQSGSSSKLKIHLLKKSLKKMNESLVKINTCQKTDQRLLSKANEAELLLLGLKFSASTIEEFIENSNEYKSSVSSSTEKSKSSTPEAEELVIDTRIESLKEMATTRLSALKLRQESLSDFDRQDSSDTESVKI